MGRKTASHGSGVPIAGIGLRRPHATEFLALRPQMDLVEVDAENYIRDSLAFRVLATVRRDYPVSLHSVGISLGSAEGVDVAHVSHLLSLSADIQPSLVSGHLSWSVSDGAYFSALLPLPYTEEALGVVCRNVDTVQHALGRRLLIENIASYLRFQHSVIPEAQFLVEVARRTGCGVLCDLNNIFVNCQNFSGAPADYLSAIPPEVVGEIHLGGHSRIRWHDKWLLFDDHGGPVNAPVWDLYRQAIRQFGVRPTIIEWDTRLPALNVLLEEVNHAQQILSESRSNESAGNAADGPAIPVRTSTA